MLTPDQVNEIWRALDEALLIFQKNYDTRSPIDVRVSIDQILSDAGAILTARYSREEILEGWLYHEIASAEMRVKPNRFATEK